MDVIVAPISKFKKNNLKIYIVVLLGLTLWCVYDGYVNQGWIAEHTNPDGTAQPYLTANRQGPFYLVGLSILLAIKFFVIKNKKIIAQENELVISEKQKIPYGAIEKIDKTKFKEKGFFIITYKDREAEKDCKLSDRHYDNLSAILDHLVAKIS